jgi:hypothetical protein
LAKHQPFQIIGYHSCDREIGLKVLNGKDELESSDNPWDWLGPGIYFWEHDPVRALAYAVENAEGKQFNKKRIKTPFVLGAIIELGNCLNLVETESLGVLSEAYQGLQRTYAVTDQNLPINKGNNRSLDCEVIKYIHQSNIIEAKNPYETIRSAFQEGNEVYPGASFSVRHHIQVCVCQPHLIEGYFLPRPVKIFNPYL